VEPFDDFRSTNLPTNKQLLDHLAKFFVDGGYQFKPLHRIILNSKTYQLSSRVPDESGEPKEIERVLFARYFPRKLSAEVLVAPQVSDVLISSNGIRRVFQGSLH
jgi:hypothetical protein